MGRRRITGKTYINGTGKVVLTAIKKLTRNTCWTSRTIIKFIKMEYNIREPNLSRKVSRALKRGVKLGLLKMDQGRYRLSEMCQIVRSVCGIRDNVAGKKKVLGPRGLRICDSPENKTRAR